MAVLHLLEQAKSEQGMVRDGQPRLWFRYLCMNDHN